jgi:hypothetical protein
MRALEEERLDWLDEFPTFELLQRAHSLQLVGAQRTCPPSELWRRSRLDGAAGSFNGHYLYLFEANLLDGEMSDG